MPAGAMTIVGIGASAGGLDAFRSFFREMPPDSGMAFIVVLHLPNDRKSMLPEILGRWTSMPVIEGADGQAITPNTVYVPPPHAITRLENAVLRIQMPSTRAPRDYRPIDSFFGSLASNFKENAVGIILSGTGSDGALGLKAIKGCGGLTIAQGPDGTSPQFSDMPSGAIATGAVDLVAPVEAIPGHLVRLRELRSPSDGATDSADEDATPIRLATCAIIRGQIGHDFSGYREQTFMRRVRRRMQVLEIRTAEAYLSRLERDREEVVLLFRDLLIRVTSFFRDAEAFATLERLVVPRLFHGKNAESAVRVWVPGCATGEEAYSLAILLCEQMDRQRGPPKIQIFATDIDEHAIATARLGQYPTALLDGLSAERRNRFFHPSQSGYSVTKEIRDLCTFSPHSVVRDPPFSRIDMISCRNLLIYMTADLQAKVIPAFHYALVPDGILLLGISESTSQHDELFEQIDKPARIFRRREGSSPGFTRLIGNREILLKRPSPMFLQNTAGVAIEGAEFPDMPRGVQTASFVPPISPHLDSSRQRMSVFRTALRRFLERARVIPADTEPLRLKLASTSDQLQALTEEHQGALEELRSANEELHSVNEELQSTNEELETSKEELQSVNEELHTVNMQLSEKVEELDRTNSDLKNLFESTEIATVFLDRHLIIRGFTPAVGTIYNLIPSDLGRPLTDIVGKLQFDDLFDDVRQVLDTLKPLERRVSRRDQAAHYIMRVLPYRSPDSSVSGTLVTFTDVTSIVQAEQHHRLLVDELNHRVKNMLTVVISLAHQTLRRSRTLDEFSGAFLGRVQGLTASYTLLSNQNWVSVSLRSVLAEETKPYIVPEKGNVSLAGPEIQLTPAGALAMGMVFHELATNAVKHGALSGEGRIAVSWRLEDAPQGKQIVVEWSETGGPPVEPPQRRGFGLMLIERSFAHELDGTSELVFDAGGVHATLRAPVKTAIVTEPPPS